MLFMSDFTHLGASRSLGCMWKKGAGVEKEGRRSLLYIATQRLFVIVVVRPCHLPWLWRTPPPPIISIAISRMSCLLACSPRAPQFCLPMRCWRTQPDSLWGNRVGLAWGLVCGCAHLGWGLLLRLVTPGTARLGCCFHGPDFKEPEELKV